MRNFYRSQRDAILSCIKKEKNYEKYIRLFQAEDRGVTNED